VPKQLDDPFFKSVSMITNGTNDRLKSNLSQSGNTHDSLNIMEYLHIGVPGKHRNFTHLQLENPMNLGCSLIESCTAHIGGYQ
jgi:hypothetical protein